MIPEDVMELAVFPSKAQMDAAIDAYREGIYLTDGDVFSSIEAILKAAGSVGEFGEERAALRLVVEYDNLLRQYTGPIEEMTEADNAAIDAAYDEMVAVARAILTDREARSGWRDIETAPQDGTQIIGRTTPDEVFACRWFLDDDGEGDWLAHGTDVVRPREWMPDPSEALQTASPSPSREETEGEKAKAAVTYSQEENDEAYEIGKRDGYSEAVQQIDQLTGGDGEYRYCSDHDPDRHTPGPAEMIQRIVDRFETLNLLGEASKSGRDQEWGDKPDTSALLLEAEKALEPFSAMLEKYDPEDEEDFTQAVVAVAGITHYEITLGDFRAARSTISKIRGGE